ncbi:MAG: response regulator [Gallionella sp.]|nr:response regulator [Gallionella sp.]PIR09838.1 MAG: two-component system response regulator [Gallionellaceae bacterium CG11_big_fil_rev_8_21_14_0_20_60_62]PJC04071.1 MAG: two-component system response regulator [Gallionellaceae bacterium CG_4_9_14_0_8_um_filter_60_335]
MSKPTLLLIDDEERILRSLRMLFFAGYHVRITTDPHEAIRILRDEKIHVIVSDQRMPVMQGSELLRIARETSPATMRILLTGYSDLDASIASVNDGEVFRYLMKPWNVEEVKSVVAEAAAIAEASFAVQSHTDIAVGMASARPRVLIMDHDETTAKIVHETLSDRCDIVWASDAQHAMEELAKQDISVVVSDLMLGETNVGYILKTIKQLNPQTQCIVVTTFNDTSRLIELINQAQITRFLPKPVSKGILARNLESMLERFKMVRNQPVLQKRQAVAPISDPQEQVQAGKFMGMLGRLRARIGV